MAKKFKKLTDRFKSITITDYLVSKLKPKTNHLRYLSSLFLTFFIIIYVSAQIDATGSAFEAFMDWNYFTGAVLGYFIVLAYVVFGGFIAVAWSDLIQGSLMFLALVILPVIGYYSFNGEFQILEGLNKITFRSEITFSSFVFGFLPTLSFFLCNINVPNFVILTFFSEIIFFNII